MEEPMDPSERSAIIRRGRQLEADHQAHVKRAAILLDAEGRWLKSLSRSERRKREYVLLALQSKKVPQQLKWGSFDRHCSNALKHDKEIFMQRLDLEEFESMYKESVFRGLPNRFRDDKEVMLKVVSKSSQTLSLASEKLQNDRDVVMAAIQSPHKCAPLAIQHASNKLQGDKRLARVLLGHQYGITAFSLLPHKLQGDYKLALLGIQCSSEECSKSYEHLSELSEEMLDDYEIVFEACKRRGSNLRFITDTSLLEDIEIVAAACENDGAAIEYVPKGPTRDEMLHESNLLVLIKNGGHMVLNELGEEYMLDREYLLPAVENDMVLSAEISTKLYSSDRPLFMDVLRHTSKPFEQYNTFSDDLRGDAAIGTAILKTNAFKEGSWAYRFSKDIPEDVVRNHTDSLITMAQKESLFLEEDTTQCLDEKTIVMSLCKIDGDKFRLASSRLRADPDVARAAFGGSVCASTIKSAPQTVFRQNHDIAALAVQNCTLVNSNWNSRADLFRHFGEQVASSRVVFVEWIRRGWPTKYHFGRTPPFSNNRSVALEAIKNCESVEELFSDFVSNTLRRNREFMVSAVQSNPEVLHFANENLMSDDYDLMLHGVSGSKDALKHFDHEDTEFDLLADFATETRSRIAVTDGVVLHFFGAMALDPSKDKRSKRRRTGRTSDNRCQLRMLDLGGETGCAIKRLIAEYAGIPIGSALKLLRSADENLKFWGY